MLEVALKLLKEFSKHSYKAYIVGGFVRDYLMGIESNDIDITTNARPKQIKEIFEDSCVPNEEYGSVIVMMKGVRFEITTFRSESNYIDNRRPSEVKYIDDLYTDLLRRDFIINTICMDEDGKIIDYLGGQNDIDKKIIRTVGDAYQKFNDDSLRILRAIRFATILDFQLNDDIFKAIEETKSNLSSLSYQRKKEELDKIFNSPNHNNGIELLIKCGLDKELELINLHCVLEHDVDSALTIWSMLDVRDKYPFNKNEQELIENINKAMELNNLDPMALYKYGLYVNSCAGKIKGVELRDINEAYNNLIIKSRDEIDIDSDFIMNLLKREPGKYLKDIYDNLEREILYRRLVNDRESLSKYILENYE